MTTRTRVAERWGLRSVLRCQISVFSREVSAAGKTKRYVQDVLRERAADIAPLLADPNAYSYVCGLKSMEEGVVLALRDVAQQAGLDSPAMGAALKKDGRLHLETY